MFKARKEAQGNKKKPISLMTTMKRRRHSRRRSAGLIWQSQVMRKTAMRSGEECGKIIFNKT